MTTLSLVGLALMLSAIFLDGWAVKEYQHIIDLIIFGVGVAFLVVGGE